MRPVVGIDIAQDELVVVVQPSTQAATYPHPTEGHQKLIRQLREMAPFRIVVQGNGGLAGISRHR